MMDLETIGRLTMLDVQVIKTIDRHIKEVESNISTDTGNYWDGVKTGLILSKNIIKNEIKEKWKAAYIEMEKA